MVFSLFYGLYILFMTTCTGVIVYKGLTVLWGSNQEYENPIDIMAMGFTGLILMNLVIALFYKINMVVHMILVPVIIAATILNKTRVIRIGKRWLAEIRGHLKLALLLLVIYLLAIIKAAYTIEVADTGYYHLPLVKWLSSYGLVPGLANLQDSFGFMSGWFYYASFFDIGMFRGKIYHIINVVAYLYGWLLAAALFVNFKISRPQLKDAVLIPLTIYLCFFIRFIPSLHPQYIVSIFMFLMVYKSLHCIEKCNKDNASSGPFDVGYLLLIAFFGLILKLSAYLALLLLVPPLFLYLYRRRNKNRQASGKVVAIVFPSLLVLIFLFIQNIIITGYIVYPITFTGFLDLPWKVPEEDVKQLVHHIKSFRKEDILQLLPWTPRGFRWLDDWFIRFYGIFDYRPVMLALLVIPAAFITNIYITIREWVKSPLFPYISMSWLLLTTVFIWFFTTPNPRFGTVLILTAVILPFAIILRIQPPGQKVRKGLLLGYLLLIIGGVTNLAYESRIYSRTLGNQSYLTYWLLDIPVPEYKKMKIADGTTIHVPSDEETPRVFNIPLPATGQELNYKGFIDTNIVRRGKSLNAGFAPAKR